MFWLCWAGLACAKEPQLLHSELQRVADGVRLSVRLTLEPSSSVEDALYRGVPIYFVWEADVVRERWYWTDKRISSVSRTLRLAYQPLTRRWRVSLSTDGSASSTGLQYALHQSYESLDEALMGVGRVAGWQVAEPGKLEEGARHSLHWHFRLDLSLLPRPFQIGVANQEGWDVEVERTMEVPLHNEVEAATGAEAR